MRFKKILFLLHIPPPVHGSSMVGKFIRESKLINNNFHCDYLNLLASNKVSDTGKISFNKVIGFMAAWLKLFFKLVPIVGL